MKITVWNYKPHDESETTIYSDDEKLVATRMDFGKLIGIVVEHDGTVADLHKKVEDIRTISCDMFRTLSKISKVDDVELLELGI